MANEITIHVREQGTAQTQSALKGLSATGVAAGAAIGVAMAAMAVKAAGALGDFAKSSVTAASNMQESVSKANVVFGEAAAGIQSFAKDSAKNMGLSTQAALEMSGTFGNLFTAMGITKPAAADMSTSILQLGADLASFNNIPVEEALLKIRAGLVGEAEPLRTLGVNLNAAAVEDEAMRLGLMKTGETLTASGKAQATYSLILQQTTNAQGDFARTSDGLANQQRKLTAEVDNLKAKIGAALLPVVTDITTKLGAMIALNGDEWARQFATGVDTASKAAAGLFDVLSKLVQSSPFQVTLKVIQEIGGGDSGSSLAKFFAGPLGLAAHAGGNLTNVAESLPEALQRIIMGTDWTSAHAGSPSLNAAARALVIKNMPGLGGGGEQVDDAMNAIFGAGAAIAGGGGTGGPTSTGKAGGKDPLTSAWESLQETLQRELITAWVKGGQGRLDAVQSEQAKLTANVTETTQRMSAALGIPLADAILPAFQSIRDAEEETAAARIKAAQASFDAIEKVMRAEEELAKQRARDAFELTKAAFGAGLGANTRDNNGNNFFTGQPMPSTGWGVTGTGPDGTVNYGVINNVYPNVTAGGSPVPSTADALP